MLTDQQQEPVATIQVAAIKTNVRLERMTINRLHRPALLVS